MDWWIDWYSILTIPTPIPIPIPTYLPTLDSITLVAMYVGMAEKASLPTYLPTEDALHWSPLSVTDQRVCVATDAIAVPRSLGWRRTKQTWTKLGAQLFSARTTCGCQSRAFHCCAVLPGQADRHRRQSKCSEWIDQSWHLKLLLLPGCCAPQSNGWRRAHVVIIVTTASSGCHNRRFFCCFLYLLEMVI